MSPMLEYANYVSRNTDSQKNYANPYPLYEVPISFGASATPGNRRYASAEIWAEAQRLWFRVLGSQKTKAAAKRHAKAVLKTLEAHPDLRQSSVDLPALCAKYSGRHGNLSNMTFTLYSTTGATATGTRSQLALATGLPYERVRDLLTGRRRFTHGWAATEEEARRGYVGGGRPRSLKPAPAPEAAAAGLDFFDGAGTEFF